MQKRFHQMSRSAYLNYFTCIQSGSLFLYANLVGVHGVRRNQSNEHARSDGRRPGSDGPTWRRRVTLCWSPRRHGRGVQQTALCNGPKNHCCVSCESRVRSNGSPSWCRDVCVLDDDERLKRRSSRLTFRVWWCCRLAVVSQSSCQLTSWTGLLCSLQCRGLRSSGSSPGRDAARTSFIVVLSI